MDSGTAATDSLVSTARRRSYRHCLGYGLNSSASYVEGGVFCVVIRAVALEYDNRDNISNGIICNMLIMHSY